MPGQKAAGLRMKQFRCYPHLSCRSKIFITSSNTSNILEIFNIIFFGNSMHMYNIYKLKINNFFGLFFGNLAQGFSSDWWKDKLYLLPTLSVRVMYFMVSQLLSGLLIGHVVTFSHNSVDKYPGEKYILKMSFFAYIGL
uniref:Uncharacterized protein n=1 Tax=Heterorhabditis bacteriophora TaxID=37862 RepID=A0A1I7WM00_HETBA